MQPRTNVNALTSTSVEENAINSDFGGDYVDKSAIDDGENSDWEDVIDNGESAFDQNYFQRVDSKVSLTSCRSLITLMLAQNQKEKRAETSINGSQSIIQKKSYNASPMGSSPNNSDEDIMMKHGKNITYSRTLPSPTTTSGYYAPVLSPRTTRRNMLRIEWTESVRRHQLWEHAEKSLAANAVLKDVTTQMMWPNSSNTPEMPYIKGSWSQPFDDEIFNEYHSRGW